MPSLRTVALTWLAVCLTLCSISLAAHLVNAPAERWKGSINLGIMQLRFALTLDRAAAPATGTMSIPEQGVNDSALKALTIDGDHLRFTFGTAQMPPATHAAFDVVVAADGQTAKGTMKQLGRDFPVEMSLLKDGEEAGPNRPQHPKPPFPYSSREVLITSGDGAKLPGTLTIPHPAAFGKGPHPAALLVTGSGTQDRDETLLGHKPFLVLADALTRSGLAVLRVDDRGWAGNFDPKGQNATTDDFVLDAKACLDFLTTQPDIDPKRIGMVGHSEGGMIAPMLAAQDPRAAFLVLLAGPGIAGDEVVRRQIVTIPAAAGAPADNPGTRLQAERLVNALKRDADRTELLAILRDLGKAQLGDHIGDEAAKQLEENIQMSLMRMQTPWFKRFLHIDPAVYLSKVKAPVLALNGEIDRQVEAGPNLQGIAAALKLAGNTDVQTREMPGLNHLFQHARTGGMEEYASIEETMSPDVLQTVAAWVRKRTGLEK